MTLSLPSKEEMNYTLYEAWKTIEERGQLTTSLKNLASSLRTCQRSRMSFPWDLLESAYSGDIEVDQVVQFEIPLLVPAALGILVALLVVIVTVCYCCCRCCCGRCGARLQFSDIEYQKRCCMYITAVSLLFCTTVIIFTALSSYESGIKFRRGPRHIVDVLDSSLDDLPAFVTNFGHDMSQLIRTELNRTLDMMHYKVKDLSNILAAPLTDIAGPAMNRIDDHIQTLQNGIDYITQRSTDTNNTVENITVLSQSFQQVVKDTDTVLLNLIVKCANDNENFCHLLLDPINNDLDFNTSQLLDFSAAIDELTTEVNSVNLSKIRTLANDSVAQLPEVIHNSSRSAVTGVLAELDKIPDTVLPELDKALEFTNMTRSSLGVDGTIDTLKNMVENFDSLSISLVAIAFSRNRDITLSSKVLYQCSAYKCFLACLSLVGLLLGFLCSKRGSYISSRSTASHIGSKFLLWTVFIAMIPTAIFLVLSSVLLVVGGNLSVICGPLQDLSLVEKLDDGYLDLYSADELAESLDVNVSLKRFVETCKEGGTIYSGLNLVETFNLSSYINVSSFIPELGSDVYNEINETIREMNVIDTELRDNMTSSFSFDDIHEHSNITHSIKEELTELNLQEWSNNLTDASSLLPNGHYANAYRSLAANLSGADTNIKIPLLAEVDGLENVTNHLQTLGDILRNSSQSISNELDSLQLFIQNQAVYSIFQAIDDFLDEMGTVPVDFINSVTLKLSKDIGRCGLIWDIYNAIISSVCGNFIDSLNVFWFSFYFGGFATVLLMICSCIIMRYFRKPDSLIDGRRYHDVTHNATSSAGHTQANKTKSDESNNNATINKVLPDWSYRVIKRKHKPRRKYCFPANQSPQLMKIRLLSESLQKSHSESNKNNEHQANQISNDLEQGSEFSNLKSCGPEVCDLESLTTVEQSQNSNITDIQNKERDGSNDNQVNGQKEDNTSFNILNSSDHDTGSSVDETVEIIDETSSDKEAVSSSPENDFIEDWNGINEHNIDDVANGYNSPQQNLKQTIDLEEGSSDLSVTKVETISSQNDVKKYINDSQKVDIESLTANKDNNNIYENDSLELVEDDKCMTRHYKDSEVSIQTDGLRKIQCALCKHKSVDIFPQQPGHLEGDTYTGPDLTDDITENPVKSRMKKSNDLSHRENSSNEVLHKDIKRSVSSLCILSTRALVVKNSANLNDAINEFNSEYDKMSSGIIVSACNTLPKTSHLQHKTSNASPRGSFIDDGFDKLGKGSNNSKTSLNIQVKPYSQFYESESIPLNSETIHNVEKTLPLKVGHEIMKLSSTSETVKDKAIAVVQSDYNETVGVAGSIGKERNIKKPIQTLSELATQAFTRHLNEKNDEKSFKTDFGHMTATCGHGLEKTTYL